MGPCVFMVVWTFHLFLLCHGLNPYQKWLKRGTVKSICSHELAKNIKFLLLSFSTEVMEGRNDGYERAWKFWWC